MGYTDPTAWWREGVARRWRVFAHRNPTAAAALTIVGVVAAGSAKLAVKQAARALPKRWRP